MAKNKITITDIVGSLNKPSKTYSLLEEWCALYPHKYDVLLLLTRYPLESHIQDLIHFHIFERAPMDIWEITFSFLTMDDQQRFLERYAADLSQALNKIHSYPSMKVFSDKVRAHIALDKKIPWTDNTYEQDIFHLLKKANIPDINKHFLLYTKEELCDMLSYFYQHSTFSSEHLFIDKLFQQYAMIHDDPLLLAFQQLRVPSNIKYIRGTTNEIIHIHTTHADNPQTLIDDYQWRHLFNMIADKNKAPMWYDNYRNMLKNYHYFISRKAHRDFLKSHRFSVVDDATLPGNLSQKEMSSCFLLSMMLLSQTILNEKQLHNVNTLHLQAYAIFTETINKTRILPSLKEHPFSRLICFLAHIPEKSIPTALTEFDLATGTPIHNIDPRHISIEQWKGINQFFYQQHQAMEQSPTVMDEYDLHF